MTTILVIAAFVLFFGVILYLSKDEKMEDKNGNGIPDIIDEKVEEVKEVVKEVKVRAKRIKEEANDVIIASKEVVKQSKDVVSAAKGGSRRGRKPSKTTNSNTKK
jgi:thermostable 8-oxoguanine DNA glycosylase